MNVLKNHSDMSSLLGPKIKVAADFLILSFETQFFACEPPMSVTFMGNHKHWPNMVILMIYVGGTSPGLLGQPP